MDRGQEAAGRAIEGESAILPRCALAQTREPLHVAPDRTGIRLERFRQRVRLRGLLLRQLESLNSRVNNRVTRRPEFLGRGPQENEAIVRGVCVERGPDAVERCRPGLLNRRSDVSAPEADDVLETPDDVIAADGAEQEHIQGQGGGTDVAVPENESAEQTSMRRIGRVVEIAVAVHEEQKHVSVSQVGAGRNPFSAEDAVLVAERQGPGRVLGHEIEHPAGQLVVMDPRVPRRGDRVDGPRFVAVHEELVLLATLTTKPVVDRIGGDRRG